MFFIQMATMQDISCPLLVQRATSTQDSDAAWPETQAAADQRWNGAIAGSRQRRTAPSIDEAPEVVALRRLIVEQTTALDKRRRRIEATGKEIQEHEGRVHDDRRSHYGCDYVQRAYNLSNYDDDDVDCTTEVKIAVCYRQASNHIRQRLADVETQLVGIVESFRTANSADRHGEKHSGSDEQFKECAVVDRGTESVARRSAENQRAIQRLKVELARADDVRRRQMLEHRRLSTAVEDAHLQLLFAEQRLSSTGPTCDLSPFSSSSSSLTRTQELSQPLDINSAEFQKAGRQRHLEEALTSVRRSELSSATASDGSRLTCAGQCVTSESRAIDSYSDNLASDSTSEDTGCGSLPDDDDLFTDRHGLVTLV